MTALKQMGDKDLKDMGIPMVLSFHSLTKFYKFCLVCFAVSVSIMWCIVLLDNIKHLKSYWLEPFRVAYLCYHDFLIVILLKCRFGMASKILLLFCMM